MQIRIPDELDETAQLAIAEALQVLSQYGALVMANETKRGLYERFVNWWYAFWRGIGFN